MNKFFSKPIEEFSQQELLEALDIISLEFKKRNEKLGGQKKPIDLAEGIKILTDLLAKKR
jgi:hypothetical protein